MKPEGIITEFHFLTQLWDVKLSASEVIVHIYYRVCWAFVRFVFQYADIQFLIRSHASIMVQHIDNLQFERWWKRWLKSADRCYIFSWLNVIEFSKRRILFIWNLRDFYVRLMIDCQLLLSRKCRWHFLFFPKVTASFHDYTNTM